MNSTGFDYWHMLKINANTYDLAHTDCYEMVLAEMEFRAACSLYTDQNLRELIEDFRFSGFFSLSKFSEQEYFEHYLSCYLGSNGDGILDFAKRHHDTLRKLGFLPIDAEDEQLSYEELEKAIQNLVSHCLERIFHDIDLARV